MVIEDQGNLLSGAENYVQNFYSLFKVEAQRLKNEWKKYKKSKSSSKKEKKKVDVSGESCYSSPPGIEVLSNASSFAVFVAVRNSILEKRNHIASELNPTSNCTSPPPPEFSDTIDSDSDDEDKISSTQSLPKIVGIGLRSVFTLVKESRTIEPIFCNKALRALLDILQGQLPEGLKGEPDDIVDSLFDLLLDLATSHGPESDAANDGSHLTAVACACLLSLVVVRGDTGHVLSAIAALLMSPRALAAQNIQMPYVLISLQRSVHSVFFGKLARRDWITYGVPKNSKVNTSALKLPNDMNNVILNGKSFVSDGKYLYLHTNQGLIKIGSGYGGTIWGHIYAHKSDFYPSEIGWLGYANNSLYFKCAPKNQYELLILDTELLSIKGKAVLEGKDWSSSVMFSDGENLGMLTAGKDEGFVIRTINTLRNTVNVTSELPLKFAKQGIDVFGYAFFDEDQTAHVLNPGYDDEIASVAAGKEFALLRTISGKLLYTGKGNCLGMKLNTRPNRWLEMALGKDAKVVDFSVGHEGYHAIFVLDDGSVLFAGTSRRGEDGESIKVRRPAKAMKPKKITKVESQVIVNSACNNGTTALVTKEGSLLMFGKDCLHCDGSTGFVSNLKDVFVVQVSLGKAHAAVLTNKGHLYTFGINNKGQCGRDFTVGQTFVKEVTFMDTENGAGPGEDELGAVEDEPAEDWEEARGMCSPGKHQWRQRDCMVCTVCRECTGYSISCLSSIRPDRNPGQECGCGEGDSGCAVCGCCRICARENCDNGGEMAVLGPSGLIFEGKAGSSIREYLRKRLEERKQRHRTKSGSSSSKHVGKLKGSNNQRSAGSRVNIQTITVTRLPSGVFNIVPDEGEKGNDMEKGEKFQKITVTRLQSGVSYLLPDEVEKGSDAEKGDKGSDAEKGDTIRISNIPPARVPVPDDVPVIQVSCGLHHTVILLKNGHVYTFGSNIHGQLGAGNLFAHAGLVHVKLPIAASHVAAGSNHTVILTVNGEVYTFGSYQKGQLGMKGEIEDENISQTSVRSEKSQPWYSFPNQVPNIGCEWGRRATWVGASGDQTYIKIDETSFISLTKSNVVANKSCMILIPHQSDHSNPLKCLVIDKRDGSCNSFSGNDQVDFSRCAANLDPLYNVIWTFDSETNEISSYNIISADSKVIPSLEMSILNPGLALPVVPNCFVTRSQAAIHLLSCLDTLTQIQDDKLTIMEESDSNQSTHNKIYNREDFVTVSRFENHGGGWGYSGHSIEAIRFMVDTDILLGGYGLFGGRGEYAARIKLFDIGLDGGDQEVDGELLAETEEMPYECGPRQKSAILFDEPVNLQANRWYVAWARVSGPSSDCGSGGQVVVTSEDQIVFNFKSSKRSNNGTDVNAGQIPQLLYRIITPENQSLNTQKDQIEPVYILSKEFSKAVSKECFKSLISLLQWSWNTLKANLANSTMNLTSFTISELERLVYISKASLRLLRTYTNEIYPNIVVKKAPAESVKLAECTVELRTLIQQILSDSISINKKGKSKTRFSKSSNQLFIKMANTVLEECHKTFVACYHAFYPTAYLKWTSLCELLSKIDKEQGITSKDRLLSAVLASLCNSTVRLRTTFPILNNVMDSSDNVKRQLSPSDNTSLLMMNSTESHHYPILVEQINHKSQIESTENEMLNWSFRDVLDRLLDLTLIPVKRRLCDESCQSLPDLVLHCCHLLAKVIAELAAQSNGTEDEFQIACGRILYTTPSRFARVNQTRSWNTGNGAADAICFSVDRPGITIAGVGVYGGVGGYDYELELLDGQNNTGNDPYNTQRWMSLDFIRGSFSAEECSDEVMDLKFNKSIPIKENVKYAIRLRNRGGRTSNGDGGLSVVKGPDGTSFTYTTCSLCFNGTTQTRGQIPHILYYSNPEDTGVQQTSKAMVEVQARKYILAMTTTIIQRANEILALAREKVAEMRSIEILGNATFITTLLPLVIAHIGPLASSDPRSGVQILTLIQEMLPHVAALNLLSGPSSVSQDNEMQMHFTSPITTSTHYTWLESEHPYKPATVTQYKVTFPETVKWLTVEFTSECGTAQPEDYLQIFIPDISNSRSSKCSNTDESQELFPVLRKLSNVPCQWPQNAFVLPGNKVIFSLETASDYMKDIKSNMYGFKCLIIGYDWITSGNGLKNLEMELAFLGGACTAGLMQKNLTLPTMSSDEIEEDLESVQETAKRIFSVHSALLGRGFALETPPSVSQALDGVLPFSCQSNERLFLRDFVSSTVGTSGGRLARWLQPNSFVDPSQCEVLYSREEMRCGWPAVITILARDQFGEIVHVPGLKVELKAVPIDKKDISDSDQGIKIRRVSKTDPMTFGGHPQPSLDVPYEVTVSNKMCFYAITIMKAYQNYSFEELRYTSPALKRSSESMLVIPNGDGSYGATWTPSSAGWYSIMITIDGYNMEDNYKVEVKEPPLGVQPPTQNLMTKLPKQMTKLRKFVSTSSAGLRIRTQPSLQSEQIGIVPIDHTIVFIDEYYNDDGVWLRLNAESIMKYCSKSHFEAWCLQYNQHLGKTLLFPVDEVKSNVKSVVKDDMFRKRSEIEETSRRFSKRKTATFNGGTSMVVITCGASGHNIRSRPNLKARPIGILALGNTVTVQEDFVNNEGVWVRIDDDSMNKFCFDTEGEAWSLAVNKKGIIYMKSEQDLEVDPIEKKSAIEEISSSPTNKGYDKGFDFSNPSGSHDGFNFSAQNFSPSTVGSGDAGNSNPFVFGTHSQHDSLEHEKCVLEKCETPPRFIKSHLPPREQNVKEKESSGGKFNALQKWLRGDDKLYGEKKGSPGRDFSEFIGVSVKELVKAIGESRTNGNGATPPDTPKKLSRSSSPKNPQTISPRFNNRSSSPVPIVAGCSHPSMSSSNCLFPSAANALGGKNFVSGGGSASSSVSLYGSSHSGGFSPLVLGGVTDIAKGQTCEATPTDTNTPNSSLTQDQFNSLSRVSSNTNTRDPSPSRSCSSQQIKLEENTASPPNTPKQEFLDPQESPSKVTEAQTQTSPENATTSVMGHFNIGTTTKDERNSPKFSRRDLTKVVKTRTKRAMSPANLTNRKETSSPNSNLNLNKDKIKEAMSPSAAECLRAVFAAFLWHEGIVHDAMACASFLKFHPTLPKEGAVVVTRQAAVQNNNKNREELTREMKASQRHSVEVSNAGNYLHIQPSTLETLTRSADCANRSRKKCESSTSKDDPPQDDKLSALPELHTVAILPPALKSLVFLWEELSGHCLHAMEQQTVLSSPTSSAQSKLTKRAAEKPLLEEKLKDRDKKGNKRKKELKSASKPNYPSTAIEREATCELCGGLFPHPVTYHMKMAHPGCGWQAGGKGYNSGGMYCFGWAGNCGDGGFGASSWYLICESCRDKYLKAKKYHRLARKCVGRTSKRKGDVNKFPSPVNSPIINENHIIIKNNAMFLLDLASASGPTIPKQQRRSSQTLSSVAENYSPPESVGPFPTSGPFQCLQALGVNPFSNDDRYYEENLRPQTSQKNYEGMNSNTRPLSECPLSDSDSDSGKNRGMFHRSVSMTTGAPWAKNSNDGRIVMTRKRNNSSSEMSNDGGSSLLCYPSAALQKLVPSMDQSAIVSTSQEVENTDKIDLLTRPVMFFVLQQHNLQHLQLSIKQSLRRAACRMYAMQALNWLIRNVTQPICLHDLLWWFVASLTPILPDAVINQDDNRTDKKEDPDMIGVCEHPLSDLVVAGESSSLLPTSFHNLLQTIADLMLLLPPGSPLQQAAIRCWGIKFTPADHMFLHRSHVFSNISKILTRSEEEEDLNISMHESHQSIQSSNFVEALKDLTSDVDIKASSRQAMIGSLTDNSTETFWESGDEDKNKTKTITILCGSRSHPRIIYIHIDNCRDLTHKVGSLTFLSGVKSDEMMNLKTMEIEGRFTGWINCQITNTKHVNISLELKGPDNSLRVRQIRVLGEIEGETLKLGKQLNSLTIQQRNCESDTLKVFRLITSQVFGKLIQGEQQLMEPIEGDDLEDSNDLREHMVGILFSRSKLTHLQKQVCSHIVQAIKKETIRLREEWETLLCSPTPVNSILSDGSDLPKAADTYCFEMLSMVLALSGSSVGRNYLSHQYGLLEDLLSLLHTGTARVQRQVISLLRRILPEIKPELFANAVGIERLPPSDFSIISMGNGEYAQGEDFNEHAPGILDVFLSCIAKALNVQVKVKGKENNGKALQTVSLATSIHPKNFLGARWWLRGCMTRKLAELIIQLLKDMASGKLSDAWALVTKAAIAENILNLTRMDEKSREPTECLHSPTLWLALSSLCVLDSDHVERLTSGQWSATDGQPALPRQTCSNHDDNETVAVIQCNFCGNLCAECDRVLHLHRKTKLHQRQVCKEEEEAIRVDLHEGCGRTKLFWILALADSSTLKALVEFRDGSPQKPAGLSTGLCRFCGATGNTGLLAIGNVCADYDCQEHAKNACHKIHSCGHICGGVRNERACLPCLHRCVSNGDLKQDADDMCMICFVEALSSAPAIQLQCGHIFHLHCCWNVLVKKWVGPRITFGFACCPICKVPMEHPNLSEQLTSVKALYEDVRRKALMRLEYEGLHKAEAVISPGGRYYQDPTAYAMDRYAYYVCYKCQKAYYGGEARCDVQQGGESFDPTELVCGGCSDVARAQMCPKHGTDFLEYKCRYCCSVAVFFCFGSTHFCNNCHDDFQRVTNIPKTQLPFCPAGPKGKQLEGDECPLHVKHPPTGEEFALGCGICRNAHTF
ncbi:E3 ubiquitin-protein ligase MYCBP2 isoform X1 [Leptopilina heterotoma]|uniref:E3 ubiquitin-protein ligase MYCBP2 isoform X1 n=1 Tax=Leptopilina heterotoma TaxID=63436 RepID=UPI001CA944DC|nr:E3 ubiquitin-protein ligase MYCBP2 isoform X1 [Leptopilina heterotoma]